MLDKIIYVQVTGMLGASARFRLSWIQGALLPAPSPGLFSFVLSSSLGQVLCLWQQRWTLESLDRVLTASSPRRECDFCHFLSLSPRVHFSNLSVDSDCLIIIDQSPSVPMPATPGPQGSFCSLQVPPGMGRGRFPVGKKK